jgi:hypothetical protein
MRISLPAAWRSCRFAHRGKSVGQGDVDCARAFGSVEPRGTSPHAAAQPADSILLRDERLTPPRRPAVRARTTLVISRATMKVSDTARLAYRLASILCAVRPVPVSRNALARASSSHFPESSMLPIRRQPQSGSSAGLIAPTFPERPRPTSPNCATVASHSCSRPSTAPSSISSRVSSTGSPVFVLRHIRVAFGHDLKDRITAAIDDFDRHSVVHALTCIRNETD